MTAPLLFVYYANDIDDPGRYQRMIGWLTDRGRPDDLTLASRVKDDLDQFPKAVERDLADLCRGFETGGTAFDGSALVAFTNPAALSNAAFVASGPDWDLRPATFDVPPVTADAESAFLPPLTRREVFAAALQRAMALTESPDASLLLVTKSHGNASLALTTLFSVLRGHSSAEAFFADLNCEVSAGWNIKGWRGMAELPNGIGVTKSDYLAVLAGTDRPIDLVIMESCESRPDDGLVAQIPLHVRRLFSADKPASYANVDYGEVFERCHGGLAFAESVATTLESRFIRQKG